MRKRMPIGVDDFEKVASGDYFYIDKSLLIKDVLDSGAKATLFPRPRRFGKTLNMSMLQYFFEKAVSDEQSKMHLFTGLKISQYPACMLEQGKYPVVSMTLKFADDKTWLGCYAKLKAAIGKEFARHAYVLEGLELRQVKRQEFLDIMDGCASDLSYRLSLETLTQYLHRYHKQQPILLIDEYDVPTHAGYLHGYYDEVVAFMRPFLGDGMKNNLSLHFAVMTGCLRVAKESIFTGMNNLKVASMRSISGADKFGLLEDEVDAALKDYGLLQIQDQVRSWYNGYTSGQYKVYNPWSIINLLDSQGKIQPYWVNTSTNSIIKQLLTTAGAGVKQDLEVLLAGGRISKQVEECIVYSEVERSANALWNFLLFSGYLTFSNERLVEEFIYVDLHIPNMEVMYFYKSTILAWFSQSTGEDATYQDMLAALLSGDVKNFGRFFAQFALESLSFFDTSGKQPERFYHALVLGMLASLSSRYEVRSNRESGLGRYDVMLLPKDKLKPGIIIEFKRVDVFEGETLQSAAQNALQQINDKKYAQEMLSRGIEVVVPVAIAFAGKDVLVLG